MLKALLAGETWISESTHYKGFDSFTTVTYHSGADAFTQALAAESVEVEHMAAHLVPHAFPTDVQQLDQYDVVILSDIGANSLLLAPTTWLDGQRSPNRLTALADWVKSGGGLMMAGGYLSFQGIEAKAQYHRTAVEEVLPVTIENGDDRVEAPEGAAVEVLETSHPTVANLPTQWPYLLGYNRLTAKPDATTVVRVNSDPLLVGRGHHQGRTLAWASDIGPHWCPEPFVTWDGYGKLFAQSLRWVAGQI